LTQSAPNRFTRSLDVSWKEGIGANIMLLVMDYYLVPYALFLGASAQEIGFLVAFPQLFGSMSQLLSVQIVKRSRSRLTFLIIGSCLQAVILIPIAMLSLSALESKIRLLIVFATLFRILGNLIGTTWGSLMSEYLPPEKRGEYFGWRAQIVGIAGVIGMILAGSVLYVSEGVSTAVGYLILFLFISMCRFVSCYYFTRMQSLPFHEEKADSFTFIQFVRKFKQSNFLKYVLYVAAITLSTQIAAPYFSVYMLKVLHFSYIQYTSVHLIAVVAGLLSFRLWGAHADHVGNARVLKTTGFMLPFIPFLWLLSANYYYIMAIELVAGFIWSGFNLAAANFIFDAVTPKKRMRCLGYCNLICGVSIFAGASLGGFFVGRLPNIAGNPFLTLFALSGVLRLLSNLLLIRKFKEVRSEIKHTSSPDLFFSVLGVRPMIGRNRERASFSFLKKPSY